jgi:hypothetical protein
MASRDVEKSVLDSSRGSRAHGNQESISDRVEPPREGWRTQAFLLGLGAMDSFSTEADKM